MNINHSRMDAERIHGRQGNIFPLHRIQHVGMALTLVLCVVLGMGGLDSARAANPLHGQTIASVHSLGSPTDRFHQVYKSGVLAYRRGDYQKSLRDLRQAESLNPQHVNTQYYLAIVLDKLSRGDEAVKYFSLVSQYGQDNRIIDYARQRLLELGGKESSVRMASNSAVSTSFSKRPQSFSIPLLNRKNALMLNATINHEATGTFIVDTGATYTSISQDIADQLSDKLTHIGTVNITTANGQIKVPKVLIKSITIDGLEAHNVEATIINLHHGSSFSGLLGLSFIRQFQLTIDPVQNQLVFRSI